MPSRIFLISANRCVTPEQIFPLGLSHLNTALRRAGHECRWWDVLAPGEGLEAALTAFRPDFVGISIRNIDDVIIGRQETFYDEAMEMCATVRRLAGCPVIVGGSGFSLFPRELLELSRADFGMIGEGEHGLVLLIAALEHRTSWEQIPGLVFRREGQVVVNQVARAELDREPALVDRPPEITAHYLRASGVLNVQTQRGCPFRCCYCTYPLIEGRRRINREAELVAEEFAQLEQLGANYAFIVDSVFNTSARHVAEICEAIIQRSLKIRWGCFLRPRGLTAELMDLMVRAGLAHIEFGCDSLCDPVLKAYHKDFTFEDIVLSTNLARERQIDYCHFLIIGGPGETMDTLQTAFENSRRLGGSTIMAAVGMRVYPGTELHERALAEGRITKETDLLRPCYYLAPGLEREVLFEKLREYARLMPGWLVGDPVPAYANLVQRLRQRGITGPLWSYFSALQRLWPRPDAVPVNS